MHSIATLGPRSRSSAGEGTEEFFASPGLNLALIRPARKHEPPPVFPELAAAARRGGHLDAEESARLERHGGRAPAGLWARMIQRLLALNAVIWFNWQIGAPVKRSLIAYDH
jgi:hypothetical protein